MVKRKQIVKKLDGLVRKILFQERPNVCVTCGSSSQLEVGHYFSRYNLSTRWDFQNLYIQCRKCNHLHETNTRPLFKVVEEEIGTAEFDRLFKKHYEIVKLSLSDLENMVTEFEDRLDANAKGS